MAGMARRELLRRAGLVAAAGGVFAAAAGGRAAAHANTSAGSHAGADSTIMIIRHAEKPTGSGAPYGISPDGTQDAHSLIVQGWTRAGALVELFAPAAGTPPRGLLRPAVVYAAGAGGEGLRPQQTVTALAARLGQQLVTTYGKGDEQQLASEIATLAGPTLVCWEHQDIPNIIAALGTVSPQPPAKWDSARFDEVWLLTGGGSNWSFQQIPELLLAGDSSTPIS